MPEIHQKLIACAHCKLSKLCFPNGLQQNEIAQLANIVKTDNTLQTGDVLTWQGHECQNLYVIKSGSFRSYVINSGGNEQTIGFYLQGELMGLDSLQFGYSTCSIVALETANVCELPTSQLSNLCIQIPNLHHQMMRIVGKEIVADHDKIILLGHKTAQEKMATFFLMLSLRYRALGLSDSKFNLSMSRHDIANFLGMTIETVSRQLKNLTDQSVLTIKNREVHIHDLTLLKQMIDPCQLNCQECE